MKKQILTRQDVQKHMLKKLNTTLWPTVMSLILTVVLIIFSIGFWCGKSIENDLNNNAFAVNMFLIPILEIVLIGFCSVYFVNLYKIKRGKFAVISDTLYCKRNEIVFVGKYNSRLENVVYFTCGRLAVSKEVCEYSEEGDDFYVVTLYSKILSRHIPWLAYHTKYYVINDK